MWTSEHRSDFDDQGFVRLPAVFSREEAAEMEALVWDRLRHKHGVRRDDPASWRIPLSSGLQSIRTHSVFRPIGGPVLRAALDALMGEGRWEEPKHWGQFLVSFPADDGTPIGALPLWHTDFPYLLPADRLVGALVFSFVGEVPPGTGGTLIVAGSPRVIARYLAANPHRSQEKMKVTRRALMQSDPWLRRIDGVESEGGPSLAELLGEVEDVDGVPVRLVELSGEPGDVVVAHPWMLHTPFPNRGDRPRFTRVQRIGPAGLRAARRNAQG